MNLVPLPKLIATDLDGTLLGPDDRVSSRTKAALRIAAAAGIEVVAATGRSRHTALPKLDGVHEIRWVVCSNGAMVWDRRTDRVHRHRPMSGALAAEVITLLRCAVRDVGVGWETLDGFGFDEQFLSRPASIEELALTHQVAEPEASTEVTKLFLSVTSMRGEELYAALGPHMPSSVTAAHSGGAFLETTAAGVDKATALADLTAGLGYEAELVMAFGDQQNDLPMLEWAGTGVAMGNAHATVHALADEIAPTNAADGVAHVIEALVG